METSLNALMTLKGRLKSCFATFLWLGFVIEKIQIFHKLEKIYTSYGIITCLLLTYFRTKFSQPLFE